MTSIQNNPAANQTSRIYGYAQTALLFAFAVVVFLAPPQPQLLQGKIAIVTGNILCGLGLLLLFIALRTIGRSIQIAPEPRPDATLVTTGIYSRFRHPIYTAIVLVVIGICLRRSTPYIAAASVIVIAFLAIKVQYEEKLLAARYPAYLEYKTRSWGLIPWHSYRSK
jgi:protein-S-isoprenylcysteine O-methyltransferase Ste14